MNVRSSPASPSNQLGPERVMTPSVVVPAAGRLVGGCISFAKTQRMAALQRSRLPTRAFGTCRSSVNESVCVLEHDYTQAPARVAEFARPVEVLALEVLQAVPRIRYCDPGFSLGPPECEGLVPRQPAHPERESALMAWGQGSRLRAQAEQARPPSGD